VTDTGDIKATPQWDEINVEVALLRLLTSGYGTPLPFMARQRNGRG
jgi:hypothetical protein